MKPRSLLLILFLCALFSSQVAAQYSAPNVVYNQKKNQIIKIFNISEENACGAGLSYKTGVINSVTYQGRTPKAFVFVMKNRFREEIGLSFINRLSNVDRSWIYTIIRKGKRVQLGVIICGSGGFLDVDVIRAL